MEIELIQSDAIALLENGVVKNPTFPSWGVGIKFIGDSCIGAVALVVGKATAVVFITDIYGLIIGLNGADIVNDM